MANAELNVILSADGKQLAATMAKAEKDVRGLDNELKQLPKAFAGVDGAVSKTSSALKAATASTGKLTKGVKLSEAALKKLPAVSGNATASLINLGRVAQDAPFGIIGIANNINPLLESFQRLRQSAGSTGAAMKGLAASLIGGGGLGLAVSVVTGLMSFFALRNRSTKDEVKETSKEVDVAAEKQKHFAEAINNASASVVRQAKDLADLRDILLATSRASIQLTDSTIKQGLARFIFDEKNVELQKILSAQIEKQLLLRKKMLGIGGLQEFNVDQEADAIQRVEEGIARVQGLAFVPSAGLKRLRELNKIIHEAGGEINVLNLLGEGLGGFFKDFLDDGKKGKDALDEIIDRAKKLAAFLQKTTIRNVVFELDPELSKGQQADEARKFIERALTARETFEFKPQVLIDGINLKPTTKYFDELKKSADKILKDLQKEISDLTERNPILIEAKRVEAENRARGAELAGSLGLNIEGVNAPTSLLTDLQKQAVNAANTINRVLAPAFGNLFNAIATGENPIKAFFQSIGQAVTQLISQLLQAAIQAAIISAIFPGLSSSAGGFGGLFKNILGFKAEGGPVFANKPYVVGERGPELFIPQGGGRIIPNNEMNSGIAGITQGSINITGQIVADGKNLRLIFARQGQYNQRNV